jgi:N-carbamoylputrescine amidase
MKVTVAATQMACSWDREENLDKAEGLIRAAAKAGAQIVLPQEVFSLHDFQFMNWRPEYFALAEDLKGPTVSRMRALARELSLVIPVCFFERANNAYYNSVAVLDADGALLGTYRKSHIPLGAPGCYEKVYLNPGDTGFLAFETAYGRIGCGVCWDQWFPESARIMALKGAELLFYPSAIGSDCHDHWETVMRGHAGANITPLIAANRVGKEKGDFGEVDYWGRSFIAGPRGELLAKADASSETFITHSFDLAEIRELRAHWGLFRDRRPDLYQPLLTQDGATRPGEPLG